MFTKRHFTATLFSLGLALCAAPVLAEENGTRDEAKAMVEAALKHIKAVGAEQAYKDFGDKANTTWHKKDMYVFVLRKDGVMVAHGLNEKLVGKDRSALKDPNGKAFVAEMLQLSGKPDGGWVEYDWMNPQIKKVDSKISFVKPTPAGDTVVGVGIYR